MSTQKLLLLFTLVAVMGGCSIWYMKIILPATLTADEPQAVPVPEKVASDVAKTEPVKTEVKTPVATPVVEKQSAAAAGSIDADIDAVAASANDSYDDSSAQAQITSSEPTLLSNAYGI
jgi:zona occludens toxin (predicted ATPase)